MSQIQHSQTASRRGYILRLSHRGQDQTPQRQDTAKMLRTAFQNTITTPIPADVKPDVVISKLHNHDFLITMSPIVTRHDVKDTDASGKITYNVWEKIDLLPFGLWKHKIQFTCSFKDTDDGVVSWIEAPLGLVSEAHYSVKPGGDAGGKVLEEQVETSVNVIFKLFVQGTLVSVRKEMHQKIIDRAREDSVGGGVVS